MTWGKRGRPTWKYCAGYGRPPHRMRYDKDFPMVRRTLKNGTVVFYANVLCYNCRNAYTREMRRMNSRLSGRATRPQDAPWKKYRKKQDSTYVRGRNSRKTRRDSEPFFTWFDAWLATQELSIEAVCEGAQVSSRTLRRCRASGHIQIHTAEKFFMYAKMPHLSQILYPEEAV